MRIEPKEEGVAALRKSVTLTPGHWVAALKLGEGLARLQRHADAVAIGLRTRRHLRTAMDPDADWENVR